MTFVRVHRKHRSYAKLRTSEVGPEAEAEDDVRGRLVHFSKLFSNLLLRDCRPVGVDDLHDHLTPVEQPVRHEATSTDRN